MSVCLYMCHTSLCMSNGRHFSGLTGWWLVENEEKCLAWFPAPYLEPCDEEGEDDDDDFDAASYESKSIN